MTTEEIREIIANNPEAGYEYLKRQALIAKIPIEEFNSAWDEYLRTSKKPDPSTLISKITLILLGVIGLVGIEGGYWHLLIKPASESLSKNLGLLGLYCIGTLIIHGLSRLTGSKTTVGGTLKLTVFLFLILILAGSALQKADAVTIIFYGFAGLIIGIIGLVAMASTYKISLFRTIILIGLSSLAISIIISVTMGMETFRKYFSPTVNVDLKNMEMESAVDIANE